MSTVDTVQLNPAHTLTDLDEFRQLALEVKDGDEATREARIPDLVDIVRGEFLAELRYEDWAVRMRTSVHAEIREVLLPIAKRQGHSNVDMAIRSACALLELDPYDEEAQLAMATQLSSSGRRFAARQSILRFAQKLKDDLDEAPSPALADAMAGLGATG
jgi:DNA-binding SARP family transcriptional activator